MKVSLGKYFAIADAAEKLDEECADHVSQIRMACAEAEQYCDMVGENEFINKFCKIKKWAQLNNLVDNLNGEEVGVKVAELLFDLIPFQEICRTRKAQAETVLEMVAQAIQTNKFLQITYSRVTDGITKIYRILPRELVWKDTDAGQRRAIIAESDGKIKLFYIASIRKIIWG